MGVVGTVQYDLDVQCYDDSHDDGIWMVPTGRMSDKNNPILSCPECGFRVAVDTHVARVPGVGGDSDV
jgi:hypothetical protein